MIEFTIRGDQAGAYLARPDSGVGPGVLVLHAWWGLTDFFKLFCDRLASEGFITLAPDLYHGAKAETIDEAERMSSNLDRQTALQEISAALETLQGLTTNSSGQVGLVGFSLGAYLGLQLVEARPEQIAAVVLFYGTKPGEYSGSQAAFLGHFAESDEFESLASVKQMEKQIRGAGHQVTFHIYPGTGHWFFEADRPSAYDPAAAQLAWERTVAFLHTRLGGANR